MPNLTSTSEFLLLEFSDIREEQILCFFVLFTVYLTAVTTSCVIILTVALDRHLHTPMYFFLMNLAMVNSLLNSRSISYSGRVAQVFFVFLFVGANLAILTVMAHDCRVAICNPLQYEAIMHRGACLQMAVSAWTAGILHGVLPTGRTFAVTFCSNMIDQFFCEVPHVLKLACSDLYLVEVGIIMLSSSLGLGCFIYIIVSYVQIFIAVLRIPSVHDQKKAISTCLPHLTVVSLFLFSSIFAYGRPHCYSSSGLNVHLAVIYAIVPPLLNPFIYSIRNKEIKTALFKLFDLRQFFFLKKKK